MLRFPARIAKVDLVQCISSEMIILRVFSGRGWSKGTLEGRNDASAKSELAVSTLQFHRTTSPRLRASNLGSQENGGETAIESA